MTKNLRFFAVIAVLLVAITACSKEEGAEVIVPQPEQENSFRVSVGDALRSAEAILNSGDRATRSVERKVKSTEIYVAKPATRSNDDVEVSFYLINYEDNAGYALVSTDKRATPVYMYADEGNITTEAFEEVPPMAIFMEEAVANYEAEVASYDIPEDILVPDSLDSSKPVLIDGKLCYQITSSYDVLTVGPYCVRGWKQGYPYNYYCNGCKVGCGPIAMGIIMAYHQYPPTFNEYSFNWEEMTSASAFADIDDVGADDTARLLREIGLTAEANYGTNSTSTRTSMIIPTFESFGYYCDELEPFVKDSIVSELNASRPVIARGDRLDDDDEYVGHAWVIDGYERVEYRTKYYLSHPPYELYRSVFHHYEWYYTCNLGWGLSSHPNLLEMEFQYSSNKKIIKNIKPNIN